MLHKDIDTFINDLTTVAMPSTIEGIANLYDAEFLHQVSLKIQTLLKIERKRFKPLEDELLAKFGEHTTRHNLREQLLSIDAKNENTADEGGDENEKNLINDAVIYTEAGKHYVKLKSLQVQLRVMIERKTNHSLSRSGEFAIVREPNTALQLAIVDKQVNDILVLFNYGADIHYCNDEQHTLLHEAVLKNFEDMIRYLLSRGLKVDAKTKNGDTPLHFATSVEVVDLLLKNNAPIDALNYHDQSPLLVKLDQKNLQVAKKLIESGACVNGKTSHRTPLFYYAVKTEDKDLISLLVSKGTKIDAKDRKGNTALHDFVDKPDLISHLISLGADITVKNYEGLTPLDNCIAGHCNLDVLKMLCSPDTLKNKDSNGESALHKCVSKNKLEAVQYLVETAGADINARDNEGNIPLYNAMVEYARYGYNEYEAIVKYLVNKGADINAKNNKEKSPLDFLKESSRNISAIIPTSATEATSSIADAIKISGGSPVFSGSTSESKGNNLALRSSRSSSSGSDSDDSDDDEFRHTSQP